MEGRLLDKISEQFNIQLPDESGIESALNNVLPVIRSSSDGLNDIDQLFNRPLLEVTDSLVDTRKKLWIFKEHGSILRTLDEKVDGGSFEIVEGSQKIMIGAGFGQIMYTLAFMDSNHLILRLYGNNRNPEAARYLMLVSEPIANKLEWNEVIERLLAKYKNSNRTFIGISLAILFVILLLIALSW